MLSIEKCKEILTVGEKKYTEEEIKIIREFLYQIANYEKEIKNDKEEHKVCEIQTRLDR
jgi:hypothetical protein